MSNKNIHWYKKIRIKINKWLGENTNAASETDPKLYDELKNLMFQRFGKLTETKTLLKMY